MKDLLLDIFYTLPYKAYSVDQLYKMLNLSSVEDYQKLGSCLNDLVDSLDITYNSNGLFATFEYFNLKIGTLDLKAGGYGFVDTKDVGIFIPKSKLKDALNGDLVLIKTSLDSKGRLEGVVERVIKRANDLYYGYLKSFKKKYFVTLLDPRVETIFYLNKEDLKNALVGDLICFKITKFYNRESGVAKVLDVVKFKPGSHLDMEGFILSSGVKTNFSKETEEELKAFKEVSEIDLEGRVSFLDKQIITIDGDDAKDLDDAISVEILDNGHYLLGVYIADVSHYVREDTFLDLDAYEKGTSIYLPDRVIPMLPEVLSNGLCSLNEGVIRLCMAVLMEIDENGLVVESSCHKGYIKSSHRMTYHNCNLILANDFDVTNNYLDIKDLIFRANKLKDILNKMRTSRGAFLFETSEIKLKLNERGFVEDIKLRNRGDAEKIIEEFMLIANETIAKTLYYLDVPVLYRVHEEPSNEKLTRLLTLVKNFGVTYKIKNNYEIPKTLQHILSDFDPLDKDIDEEEKNRREIINKAVIRSMAKAKYADVNLGHFGLQSKCYVHFTSPIRRYPDLMIHRLLKTFLLGESYVLVSNPYDYYLHKVSLAAASTSKLERSAEKLERDCTNYKVCEYYEDKIGKIYEGNIASFTSFGIYITFDNSVEVLCRYKDLHDDYYDYDELRSEVIALRKGKVYHLGDRVRVKIIDCIKGEFTILTKLI